VLPGVFPVDVRLSPAQLKAPLDFVVALI
jgi:hypothetical protein